MWYHIIHKQHSYYADAHDDCEHTNFDDPVGLFVFQRVSGKKVDRAQPRFCIIQQFIDPDAKTNSKDGATNNITRIMNAQVDPAVGNYDGPWENKHRIFAVPKQQ